MSRTSPGRIRRAMAEETQSSPQIVVAFQNYTPPFEAEKAVRRMPRSVRSKSLHGLHTIVLTNADALSQRGKAKNLGGVAESYWARLSVTTVGNGGASLRASQFLWTILRGGGVTSGYGSGSFETCNYQRFSFTSWATTFIAFTYQSTRERKMSRTNGANG